MPFVLVNTGLHRKLKTCGLYHLSRENLTPLLGFVFVFSRHLLLTCCIFYFVDTVECKYHEGMDIYLFIAVDEQ